MSNSNKYSSRWALHNIVGHPLMEVLHMLGLQRLGNFAHDVTLPRKANS